VKVEALSLGGEDELLALAGQELAPEQTFEFGDPTAYR
jgi:hypothetical protein